MYHLLELFYSEQDDYLLDAELKIIKALLVVACSSIFYTAFTVLFHKYGVANTAVTNWMSQFLFFPQPRPLRNWLMETWDITKELELFYVALLTVPLYIQWDQFVIVKVNPHIDK